MTVYHANAICLADPLERGRTATTHIEHKIVREMEK